MTDLQDYYLPEIGMTENIINIKLSQNLQTVGLIPFIKDYKISNFWKGKFFIKRLINKIFKYKLKKNMNWNTNFWNNIQVQLIASDISIKEKYKHKNIVSFYSQKRKEDILKYQSMINNKVDLGFPLFITGECVNLIGGDVNEKEIYMLDGSRRLAAYILSNILNIRIWLITLNK